MRIKNIQGQNENRSIQSQSVVGFIDTETILENVALLNNSYSGNSPMHSVYLDTIKDIQISLIEQLKNDQFEDPFFVASTTANFVSEIIKDLKRSSNSHINELIEEFHKENPSCHEQIISSKLGMIMSYRFIVGQMSQFEDRLRAKAMAKAGKTCFTKNDKKRIIDTLTSVIYNHTRIPVFSKYKFGVVVEKIAEKTIKFGVRLISLIHINKSISISRTLIQESQSYKRLRSVKPKKEFA